MGLQDRPSPSEHRLTDVKGHTVTAKTGRVDFIRITCSCRKTFDAPDRIAATDALEIHQRLMGVRPQRG